VSTFLLTCLESADNLVEQATRCRASTLQICDRIAPEVYGSLRQRLPIVRLVQVVHVTGPEALDVAREVSGLADAILLDSGDPRLDVKVLGGTGRTHDWVVSWRIRESVAVPVYLAGGLRADNVAAAIRAVRPFAVDVCSGVRTDGALDEAKLAAFFAAVRSADAPSEPD
jgi:phosphoribosylanthranilate isomerase